MTRPDSRRHQAVAGFFSREAKSWHDRYRRTGFDDYNYQARAAAAHQWLQEVVERVEGRRLLELGCGAGVQAHRAAREGWAVVACDLSTGILAEASSHYVEPDWVAAAVEDLPFRPQTFDAVMLLGVIGYVTDPEAALRAIRDQVKPGGYIIISWASPPPMLLDLWGERVSRLPVAIYRRLKRLLSGRDLPDPVRGSSFFQQYNRFWKRSEFLTLLEELHLQVEEHRAINFGRFRFMGKALWPEFVDIRLSRTLDRLSESRLLRGIGEGARTHVALTRVPGIAAP